MKKNTQNMSLSEERNSDIFGLKIRKILGISFFGSSFDKLLRKLEHVTGQGRTNIWITTVNPEFIMLMRKDNKFADIINKSDIKVIDGVGLIWAYNVLKYKSGLIRWWKALKIGGLILRGKKRRELISGSDLMGEICKIENKKIYFLGGWGDRAKRTADYFKSRNEKLETRFSSGEPQIDNDKVIKDINKFEPDYLFVAYGMKRQEEWIEANLDRLKVGVVMGVGRSFDYYSGDLKRAPKWMRKMGLEWLFSLIREPKRWKRQLVLPKFIWMVLIKVA